MSTFKILDGAMGSELIRWGMELPEHIWSAAANLTNPELVLKIHREYVDAGADYITANTFRTTPRAFGKLDSLVAGFVEVNKKEAVIKSRNSLFTAVELAKEVASNSVKVLGSIASLEDCYSPELFPGKNTAITEFRQLGGWLSDAGVDILLLETMNSIAEAIGQDLNLNVAGPPDVVFQKHPAVTKCGMGCSGGRIQSRGQFFKAVNQPHPPPCSAGGGFDQQGKPPRCHEFLHGGIYPVARWRIGHHRNSRMTGQLLATYLVAQRFHAFRGGTNKYDIRLKAGPGETWVFRQEPVARMDRLSAAPLGDS